MIEVFSVRSPISENDIVTILPLQLVSIREVSDDFSMTFFKVDKEMFLDIMSGLGKITPDFFFYMRKNFLYSVNDVDRNRFLGFCRTIDLRGSNDDPVFLRETILHLLRIYYWDFYVLFQQTTSAKKRPFVNTNKENIAMRFAMLGGDLVGMTNIPESVLAREAEMCYTNCSIVTNMAAGISPTPLSHSEVVEAMAQSGKNMARLIEAFIADNGDDETECGCAHCMAEFGGFKL